MISLVLRIFVGLIGVVIALLIVGYFVDGALREQEREAHPAPGKVVTVIGRKVHILCKGERHGPLVVIEPGAAEPAMLWWAVQDEIAIFARVCTYDRAGYQWSDPHPTPRSITDRSRELRAVLAAAGETGPYILVSHSFGGAIVRNWAREDLSEIAGFVFVDTPDEGNLFSPAYMMVIDRGRWILPVVATAMRCGVFRLMSVIAGGGDDDAPRLSPEARANWDLAFTPDALFAAHDDLTSIANADDKERAAFLPGAFGDKPLAVVMHGEPFPGDFAALEPGFRTSQERLAALSSRDTLTVAERANHNINIDRPDVIVDAVRRIVEQVAGK